MVDVTLMRTTEYDSDTKSAHVHREGTCLSSDTKPTNWDGGSILMELDTSTLYVFDAENSLWREWT